MTLVSASSVVSARPASDVFTGASPRAKSRLDEQWKFQLGDVSGAEAANFDDSGWRVVDVPHDWSVELPRVPSAPNGGAGGFFQNGIGWYRKTLAVDPTWMGKRVLIEFEGIYRGAEVFVNGRRTGVTQPYGYVPFAVDLSEYMKEGDATVTIAVCVDNEVQPSARWFTGAGIYRHVWLHTFAPTHIVPDTFRATTVSLSADAAVLRVEASVVGGTDSGSHVEFSIYGPSGEEVASASASGDQSGKFSAELEIAKPCAWSPDSPSLYRVVACLHDTATSTPLDAIEVTTGLRTLAWTAERGLLLNGQSIKLNGGNIHHDNGILGAAAYDRAEVRKVELLKAAGFNAVRTAHNPHSIAFLDACDRLGLLVLNDMYDGWAEAKTEGDYHLHFAEWHARDVERWVRRDWNHPSVIFWCIGNEVMERGKPEGLDIAKALAGIVRSLDSTRPVTAAVNGAWGERTFWESLDPYFAVLDVCGYNYELASREGEPWRAKFHTLYPEPTHVADHARVPKRLMMATESFQSEVFINWKTLRDHSYAIGDFVWTALDYLGEATIGATYLPGSLMREHWTGGASYLHWPWPWLGAYCGDIDLTGWRKPVSHYREIVWNGASEGGKKLYMAVQEPPPEPKPTLSASVFTVPQIASGDTAELAAEQAWQVSLWAMPPGLPLWDWPQSEGKWLSVEVYSRYEAVRLYLNGQKVGEAPTGETEEFKAQFRVQYAAGELLAVGLQGGEERERFALKTGGPANGLRATVDHAELGAGGQDVAFVTIEAIDAKGQWQPWASQEVEVQVSGAGRLVGLGTANVRDTLELYTASKCRLFQGRALAVIRTGRDSGAIAVRVSAPGLAATELSLTVR